MPVNVRREGRRTTIIQPNVRDEAGLVSITTSQSDGWWDAIIVGKRATIFAMRQMPANENPLGLDFPFVVGPTPPATYP
jgi:hypothetical protein